METNVEERIETRRKITPDQEVWVKERIKAAIRMALALNEKVKVHADRRAFEYGLDGIAEGAAVEISQTLGLELPFANLRKLG